MKKIVISGGFGFIGSNLVKYFLKKKYFVINIDKLSYSANKYNLKNIPKKNYIFYKTDIGNKSKILKILNKHKPDYFFNLAAETHVDRSIDSPEPFIKNNFICVFNLLEAIRSYIKKTKNKFKLIHVSTDEVYGDLGKNKNKAKENSPYFPSSPYAASKASADHLIKSYIRTFKLPAIISNCSNNYGPRQFPEKLIPKIIFNNLNNIPIPIYGKGTNYREWIYVKDHCNALDVISRKGKIGQNYNIGSDKILSNLKLVKLILNIMKKKKIKKTKIIFVKDRPGHDVRYALNSSKIKNAFRWKTKISINKGLSKTIDWYIGNPKYFKNLKMKDYKIRLGLNL